MIMAILCGSIIIGQCHCLFEDGTPDSNNFVGEVLGGKADEKVG